MRTKESGYYISLDKHCGFMGLRKAHIGDYPSDQSAIDFLRESKDLLPGRYELTTYWDGEMFGFGSTEVNLDSNRDVFIENIKCNTYQIYREFVYARAFCANPFFSKEEREHYRDVLTEFEKAKARK